MITHNIRISVLARIVTQVLVYVSFGAIGWASGHGTANQRPDIKEKTPIDVIAEMTHYEPPDYPKSAETVGMEGLVWVKALISTHGQVREVVIYRSSGYFELDYAALMSAPGCKFKPAQQKGRPVAMWVTWKVDFRIDGGGLRSSLAPFELTAKVNEPVLPIWWEEPVGSNSHTPWKAIKSKATDGTREFDILLIREVEEKRRRSRKARIIINGGCADGLRKDMKAAIWDDDGHGGQVKLAKVKVLNVTAFESLCEVVPLKNKIVSRYHLVRMEPDAISAEQRLTNGMLHFEKGKYEYALAYFESVEDDSVSTDRLASLKEECRLAIQASPIELSDEDISSLEEKSTSFLEMAEAYFRLSDWKNARRHLDRILVLDSVDELALELNEAMNLIDSCNLGAWPTASNMPDSLMETHPPKLTRASTPQPPIAPYSIYATLGHNPRYQPPDMWVQALVSSRGRVIRAAALESSGLPYLDWAAIQAAYRNEFEPATSCGKPVSMWVKWRVSYSVKR